MSMFGGLKEKITQYVEVYVQLIKVNLISKTSSLLGYLLFSFIGLFIFFSVILFMGMGLAEVFTEAGLSRSVSFFLIGSVFLLLLVLVVLFRKGIMRFFANGVISALSTGDDDDDDNDE